MRNLTRHTKTGMALLLATSLGAAGAVAQTTAPDAATGSPPAAKPMAPRTDAAKKAAKNAAKSALIGLPAFSLDGKQVGAVKSVVKAPDGKISEVVLSRGGVLGIGARTATIPADKIDRKGKQIVIALPEKDISRLFQ